MEKEIRAGHQVYIICPLVEESELAEGENVLDYARSACGTDFPSDIQVGYTAWKNETG